MTAFETYLVKIVPDAAPNADGQWTVLALTTGQDPFLAVPLPGYHVVAARPYYQLMEANPGTAASLLQDGGPMHARFLRGGQS